MQLERVCVCVCVCVKCRLTSLWPRETRARERERLNRKIGAWNSSVILHLLRPRLQLKRRSRADGNGAKVTRVLLWMPGTRIFLAETDPGCDAELDVLVSDALCSVWSHARLHPFVRM